MKKKLKDMSSQTELEFQRGMSKVERYKWRTDTERGELRWVHKSQLNIDTVYQRGMSEKKSLTIASEFSWPAFGVLVVAERGDGRLFVIDGQHRASGALRRSDVAEVPCIVFSMADVREEAGAFLDGNTLRKPLSGVDRFKARLQTGDPAAVFSDQLIRAHGRVVSSSDGPNTVRCIGSVLALADSDPARLSRVFALTHAICAGVVLSERILEGLMYLDARCPPGVSVTDRAWYQRFTKIGAAELIRGVRVATEYRAGGGTGVWAEGLLNVVNKGLQEARRLNITFGKTNTP
jgi:hypothetical protein